jgi:hypothetical protein
MASDGIKRRRGSRRRLAGSLGAGAVLAGALFGGCGSPPHAGQAGRPANAEVMLVTRGDLRGQLKPLG